MAEARKPSIPDFQRNLDTVIHAGEHAARSGAAEARSKFAARGLGKSGPLLADVLRRLDEIHAQTVTSSMELAGEFSSPGSNLSLADLAKIVRGRFENFECLLLGLAPAVGNPALTEHYRQRYACIFKQRLDGALRDIEIGFIEGRRMSSTGEDTTKAPPESGVTVHVRVPFFGVEIDPLKFRQWWAGYWMRLKRIPNIRKNS